MQITATSAVQPVPPIADAPPQGASRAAPQAVPQAATPPAPPVRLLNPQPIIDPALGIVVTEYFNRAGTLTNQYPTEKALDSYRIHGGNDAQEKTST